MKVVDLLRTKKTISVEIEPPVIGESLQKLENFLDQFAERVDFIDITYHSERVIRTLKRNGKIVQITQKKKPGTAGVAVAIKKRYSHVAPVPHVICTGFNAYETEEFLVELDYLGIENIVALKGDNPKDLKEKKLPFPRTPYGHLHANRLIEQIANLRKGIYVGAESGIPVNFCIGAACYPEKHTKTQSWKDELKWLKAKVDAGADYLVTQMFFDNEKYLNFVRLAREEGIAVPILPGIKILSSVNQLTVLPEYFGCSIPPGLRNEVEAHPSAVKEIGLEWCVSQCRELRQYAQGLHFYAARGSPVSALLEKL